MIDYVVCFVGMFATISPFGGLATVLAVRQDAARPNIPQLAYLAPLAAWILLSIAAAGGSPLLDLLDVSGSSFQFAAAAIMLPLAARLLISGDSMAVPQKLPSYLWLVPFAVPMLASPTSLVAAASYSDRIGMVETLFAAAVVLAATGALFATITWWERRRLVVVRLLARASGVLVIGMAVEMALDGLFRI